MQRKLILTDDGSHSIEIPEMNVTYHSFHGAIKESKHVFIEAGLYKALDTAAFGGTSDTIHIFEMGFGTGLNALLTLIEAEKFKQEIYYETVELSPLDKEEIKSLNYCEQLQHNDLQSTFEQLHFCEWEKEIEITDNFILKKLNTNLIKFSTERKFNLIYFDAFAPNAQPELWTEEIFKKMFSILKSGGILVTYCSKGTVRRAMQAACFTVEKIQGPPGKREMLRAKKSNES